MTRQSPLARLFRYGRLMRQRAREGHLPFLRQSIEMLALGLLTGNGPGYYLAAGHYRREVPWRDKRMHLGGRAYRDRMSVLNPERLRPLTQSKLVEKSLLTSLGFPTPRFVGFLHPDRGRTSAGQRLRTCDELAALLRNHVGGRIAFKLLEGWAGQGFFAADIESAGGELRVVVSGKGHDSRAVPVESFCQTLLAGRGSAGRVIEEYFSQHPIMARFNPSSVNTCRIWAAAERSEPARAVLAYVRMGREGSVVDNVSAGGIVAPIDVETGVTRAAIDALPERATFDHHPDHGAPIAGCTIPFWREAKALAEESVTAFPGLRFAGVDVAIGPDGPVILELNATPDREGAVCGGIPSGSVLPRG